MGLKLILLLYIGNGILLTTVNCLPAKSNKATSKPPSKSQSDKEFLKNVLGHPRVRFYEKGSSTADNYIDYDLKLENLTPDRCFSLELIDPWLPLNLQDISVDTFGTCVRLYEAGSCLGWSLAYYPGSNTTRKVYDNNEIKTQQKVVNSIGPCLKNEFNRAKVVRSYDGTRKILKDPAPSAFVPDELRITEYEKRVSFSTVTSFKIVPLKTLSPSYSKVKEAGSVKNNKKNGSKLNKSRQ